MSTVEAVSIRLQLEELEKLKKEAYARRSAARSEESKIEDKIRAVIATCSKSSGKKHAGGGGGLGGSLWIKCDICLRNHVLTESEFKSYPGEITWISTGN